MKIQYIANDGGTFGSAKQAKRRDSCYALERCFREALGNYDAKSLESFVGNTKRVNGLITGILKAITEVDELGKIEEDEEDIPF